jgi:outer membrane protein OmpA-like peptidoglycan-associated protein
MTGLVADENGQFISQDLPPGEYTFHVFADHFRDGTCTVSIPETAPPQGAEGAAPPAEGAPAEEGLEGAGSATVSPVADAAYMDGDGNLLAPLRCELKELPKVADVTGLLVDSVSGGSVPDAKVRITDNLNRSLELDVDAQGSFQFRNVPFGEARLTVTAPGYMTTILPIKIESRKALEPHVLMNKRPDQLDLTIGRNQITPGSPIRFVPQTADVAVDSMVMVEQLAEALKENAELENIEIQVHTDDSGSPTYSRRLSQQRADRLKQLLSQLGVAERRITAKGYGPDQPLAPNVSEANRARNNRVQIMLK